MPKQPSLFSIQDQEDKELPICILHNPTWAEAKDIHHRLASNNKDLLQTKGAHILALLKKYNFRFKSDNGETEIPPIIAMFMKSKSQCKDYWVRLLALFYDPHNFNIIFEDMRHLKSKYGVRCFETIISSTVIWKKSWGKMFPKEQELL